MSGVRKYKVRYAVAEDGTRYSTKFREFASLRAAAIFVRDLPSPDDFMGIQAVDYGELTDLERHTFGLFTDGKVMLK